MIIDTIIIGKGPAGISAALYLKRLNYNPVIIGKGIGALKYATHIDNYYGSLHIEGPVLYDIGLRQAKSLGIEIKDEEVVSISYEGNFIVETNVSRYEAKTVFLAIGKSRAPLLVRNAKDYEGKGLSYCAICDGFFYRGKKIGVVGSGPYMESELKTLENITSDIVIFSSDASYTNEKHRVIQEKIDSLIGDDHVEGVKLVNGEIIDVDGIFIASGTMNATGFAKHLGIEMNEHNDIVTHDYMTNIPGLFAGGDVIGGLLQVSKATSDGAAASMQIKNYLEKN